MSDDDMTGIWENVNGDTDRMRVPGGWLYRSQTYASSGDCDDLVVAHSEALAFVPETP